MQEALVSYLERQQSELGLPNWQMAQKLEISESNWAHIRSRRRLSTRVLDRAVARFPGILEVMRPDPDRTGTEKVPA